MEDLDLGLMRPATPPLKIVYFIAVVIKVVTMEELDICIKRPATIYLAIVEQVLVVMVAVDIGLRPATLPPITQVDVVDCCFNLLLNFMLRKIYILIIGVI